MRTRISATVLGALLVVGLVPAVANAEYYGIDDPADTPGSHSDVYAMTARHGEENVAVAFQLDDLRRSSGAGISVFIDTRKARRGPEFVLSSGLGAGTDNVFTRARRWKDRGGAIDCDYDVQIRWKADRFRAVIDRDCLGEPDRVRVSAKMVDHDATSGSGVDWVPATRRWSLWLRPGNGS